MPSRIPDPQLLEPHGRGDLVAGVDVLRSLVGEKVVVDDVLLAHAQGAVHQAGQEARAVLPGDAAEGDGIVPLLETCII